MHTDSNTEEKILKAASKVFQANGYAGARMEDIALEAGINRTLLHYYFRSKEKLFGQIFQETMARFLGQVMSILDGNLSLEKKIRAVVEAYSETFRQNPNLPLFVLGELRQNPGKLADFMIGEKGLGPLNLMRQLMDEMQAGNIKPTDPRHFLTNLMGLTLFPYLVEPLLKKMFDMSDDDFLKFLEERKALVPVLVMQSLKP